MLEEEKQKRRAAVAREVEKRKAVEQTLDDLYDWIGKLHVKIDMANKEIIWKVVLTDNSQILTIKFDWTCDPYQRY